LQCNLVFYVSPNFFALSKFAAAESRDAIRSIFLFPAGVDSVEADDVVAAVGGGFVDEATGAVVGVAEATDGGFVDEVTGAVVGVAEATDGGFVDEAAVDGVAEATEGGFVDDVTGAVVGVVAEATVDEATLVVVDEVEGGAT